MPSPAIEVIRIPRLKVLLVFMCNVKLLKRFPTGYELFCNQICKTSQHPKENKRYYLFFLVVKVLDTILHNLTLKLFRLFNKVQYFIAN